MKTVLFPPVFMIFCTVSRYLICIAEDEFSMSDDSFIILADSTSALAEIIVAYETLFWIAADCMFLCTSIGRIMSLLIRMYL